MFKLEQKLMLILNLKIDVMIIQF